MLGFGSLGQFALGDFQVLFFYAIFHANYSNGPQGVRMIGY